MFKPFFLPILEKKIDIFAFYGRNTSKKCGHMGQQKSIKVSGRKEDIWMSILQLIRVIGSSSVRRRYKKNNLEDKFLRR